MRSGAFHRCLVSADPSSHCADSAMLAITNVQSLDGESPTLSIGTVTVDGERIVGVTAAPPPEGAEVIDGPPKSAASSASSGE